jgi:hypothetical protein
MTGTPENPPVPFGTGRVCIQALFSQVYGMDGLHPRCLGTECSSWEICLFEAEAYAKDLLDLRSGKKPAKRERRGEKQ